MLRKEKIFVFSIIKIVTWLLRCFFVANTKYGFIFKKSSVFCENSLDFIKNMWYNFSVKLFPAIF